MKEVVVVRDVRQAEALASAWRACRAAGASEIFTAPEWCLPAWRLFPELGAPRLYVARNRHGDIVGAVPLTESTGGITFAGTPLGDEHDFRVLPGHGSRTVARALAEAVLEDAPATHLTDVRPGGVLASVAAETHPGTPSPVIRLHHPADPQFGALSYVPGWSTSRRKSLHRLRRRLAEQGQITFTTVSDAGTVSTLVPHILQCRLDAWRQRGRLLELPELDRNPVCGDFLGHVGAQLAAMGKFFVAQLCVNTTPIAQNLCFRASDSVLIYMTAFDPQYGRFSPSHLLLADLAHHCRSEGTHVLEYGRGDEPYKFSHGAEDRHLCNVTLKQTKGT